MTSRRSTDCFLFGNFLIWVKRLAKRLLTGSQQNIKVFLMLRRPLKLLSVTLVILLFAGCSRSPRPDNPAAASTPDNIRPEAANKLASKSPKAKPSASPTLVPVAWKKVEGWREDDPRLALGAFLKSCSALRGRQEWQQVCAEVTTLSDRSERQVRNFFERSFTPYQLRQPGNDPVGLVTGYYIPDLRGSRESSPAYPYPLYGRPADLLAGKELLWVDDPVELLFLQIQESGRILFEDGSRSIVRYTGKNGHPYRSVRRWLIERGIISLEKMSMQNIMLWARGNPSQVDDFLNANPSYVSLDELPRDADSVPGALGLQLTPGRSVAVDPRYSPLGTPVFLSTTWPNTDRPLYRLMMAQDTGGAIKGPVRADFFWGMGDAAGTEAGRMKQPLKMWVLLPVGEQ